MMAVTKDMENGPTYRPRHRTAGALLFLGHLLETTVQIFVCYHYFDGFPRWAGGLTAILLAAALIVNLASIVGVQQSLDFADRCFGQCLCYTMHLCGLGLVWRYLKLAMLYDYADLKEFALLRFIQVHLQTLPSLLLQASLVYQGQGGWQWSNLSVLVVPMLLVGLQLVSVTVTLVSSTIVLMPHHTDYTHNYCHKTLINWCPPTITTLSANKGAVGKAPAFWRDCEGGGSGSANRQWVSRSDGDCFTLPLTTVKSFSLLACRLFAVAVFMMEFHVWTLIIFGVHWCITLLWLVVQDSPSEMDTATPVASLCRRVVVAYLLVFDWPSTSYNNHHNSLDTPAVNASRVDDTAVNLKVASGPTTTTSLLDILVGNGGAPRTVAMAVYYGVVGLENAVMVSLWFQFASLSADDEHAPLVRLGTLAFCVATFTIGILCVLVSTKGCQSPNEKEPLPANCVDLQGGDGASMQIEPLPDKHFYMHSNLGEKQANASSFAVTQVLVHQHQHLVQPPPQHLHHHSISPNHPPPPVPINCPYILPNNSSSSNHLLAPAYAATDLHWEAERIREDDESSNSRNTNTLEGVLGSANGGSGLLALGITPSPPITVRRPQLVDPSIKVLGLSRLPLQSVEYRDRTGSFTGSHSSFATALASLTRQNRPLPLHHKLRCSTPKKQRARPRASLQQQPQQQRASLRLCRQASSSDSLATIPPRAGQHSRTYRCFTKKRHQRRKRMCRRYNRPCHCRIFDQSEQVGFGLLVQESKLSRSSLANTLPTATTAPGGNKLTNNNSNRLTARGQDVGRQGRQLRIFCASCLEAHDPLLTHCAQCRQYQVSPYKSQTLPSRHPITTPADATEDSVMNGMQMTRRYSVYNMDYPSDTEITAGLSRQSVISSSDSSLDSEATYTTWPPPRQASSNVLRSSRLPGEVPSWSYVHSWLMNSGTTSTTRHQPPAHHHHHRHPQHSLHKRRKNKKSHNSLLPGSEPTLKAPISSVRNSTSMPPLSVATTPVNPLSCAVFPHAHSTLYKSKFPPHADPIERLSAIVV